jgi:hypothetical protein
MKTLANKILCGGTQTLKASSHWLGFLIVPWVREGRKEREQQCRQYPRVKEHKGSPPSGVKCKVLGREEVEEGINNRKKGPSQ